MQFYYCLSLYLCIYKEYSLFSKCPTSFCCDNVTAPVVTVALPETSLQFNFCKWRSKRVMFPLTPHLVWSSTRFQYSMTTKFGRNKVLKSDEWFKRLWKSILGAHWQVQYRNVLLCNPWLSNTDVPTYSVRVSVSKVQTNCGPGIVYNNVIKAAVSLLLEAE